MANIPLIAAGVAGALAVAGVGFALGTANPTPGAIERAAYDDVDVKSDSEKPAKLVKVKDTAAEDRAALAERRAIAAERAAEAKIACERERQRASNQGAVVGGVAGAVIGSQIAGSGAKSEGAVIGGLGGVLTGRQIAKKDHRC
jgi:uncharacterized protein YcfJ